MSIVWRFDIINYLIEQNDYKSYLEIGVEGGDNVKRIKCSDITGVDPYSPNATHKIPSDDFFANNDKLENPKKWDIIFIDGDHREEQTTRDVLNSLKFLNKRGTIVMHDCNPPTIWHQRPYEEALKNGVRLWNGQVWKSYVKLRNNRADLKMYVVNTDWGCGIIQNGIQETLMIDYNDITYENFDKNRIEWLNLISPEEFKKIFERKN